METFGLYPYKVTVGDVMNVDGKFKEVTSKTPVMVDEWPYIRFMFSDLSLATVPCDGIVTILL